MTILEKKSLVGKINVAELAYDPAQFDIPSELYVNFEGVNPTFVYKDQQKTDEIAKYVLNGLDVNLVKLLQEANSDLSQLNGITIEVVTDFDSVADLVDAKYAGPIKLTKPVVMPLCVSRGKTGSFSGIKMVTDSVTKAITPTKKGNA